MYKYEFMIIFLYYDNITFQITHECELKRFKRQYLKFFTTYFAL